MVSARIDFDPAILGIVSLREENLFDLADKFRVKMMTKPVNTEERPIS